MIEPNPHRSGTRSEEARKHSTDLGEHFVLEVRTNRRRSLLENFFTFSVIPSLLAWAVIVLLIRAQFDRRSSSPRLPSRAGSWAGPSAIPTKGARRLPAPRHGLGLEIETIPTTSQLRMITVGDLRRSRTLLRFTCARCAGTRLFDPFQLPFGNLQPILTINRRMKCSVCGWDGESSACRPDSSATAMTTALRKAS